MSDRLKIVREDLLADNWGTLKRVTFELLERDGVWRQHKREVYDRGNAAVILLYNPAAGTVLLIRQFRLPVTVNGDDPWLIEASAGLLEGDDPDTCARKEALEETGYRPRAVRHLFDSYMSPGSVTEKLSFFIGEYAPGDRVAAGGGLATEGEDIEVLELDFADALSRIGKDIVDAKTVMLLQQLALSGLMAAK